MDTLLTIINLCNVTICSYIIYENVKARKQRKKIKKEQEKRVLEKRLDYVKEIEKFYRELMEDGIITEERYFYYLKSNDITGDELHMIKQMKEGK